MEQKQPQIAVDPNLQSEQAAASKTLTDNLMAQAQGDTAQMMARYGTRLALSGAGMTPMAAGSTSPELNFKAA